MRSHMQRSLGLLLAVSLLSATGPSLARPSTTVLSAEQDAATPVQADDDMPLGDADMPEGDFDLEDDEGAGPDDAAADDAGDESDDGTDEDDASDDDDDASDDDEDGGDVEGEDPDEGATAGATSGDEDRDIQRPTESSSAPQRQFVTTESSAGVAEPEEEDDGNTSWWIAGAGVTLGVALLAGLAATTYLLLDEFGLGTGSVTVTPR